MKRPWVVKAGGELLTVPQSREKILRGLKSLHRTAPVLFVHGGGPQIEEELQRCGVAAPFIRGRRVTSDEAMAVVERVLSGQINKALAAQLSAMKVPAVGLSGRDGGMIQGEPIPELGRAARPRKINVSLCETLLKGRFLPIVSSVASDKNGEAVNINADDVASALAQSLRAAHLVFLTNISGVKDASGQRIPVLRARTVKKLIDENVITGGMIPKVQSAVAALRKGVHEVDIINGFEGLSLNNGTRILP